MDDQNQAVRVNEGSHGSAQVENPQIVALPQNAKKRGQSNGYLSNSKVKVYTSRQPKPFAPAAKSVEAKGVKKARKNNMRVLQLLINQYRDKFINDGTDPRGLQSKQEIKVMERQIRLYENELLGRRYPDADLNIWRQQVLNDLHLQQH